MDATTPFWLTAFIDLPAESFDEGVRFWSAVSGGTPSPTRGERHEFLTLLPESGDDFVRMQRLESGPARLHLDIHVQDPQAAAGAAARAGCRVIADLGYVVMQTPGGFTFCYVTQPATAPPGPVRRPGGWTTSIGQICLDLTAERWPTRDALVAGMFGGTLHPPSPNFPTVAGVGGPLEVILQRLDCGSQDRAHLDLFTNDRDAEIEFQVALGAEVVQVYERWTTMRGPGGQTHCVVG